VLLKKLEIFGFKSFAHKLSLEFGPGITCVVGPNGCGKTNVADAIRWVLGEQSPSELRGSSMADVIFNGTKKRRRLGMAEVTLSIDNSEGFLPTDYSEVVIGRRVFRSGESEYLINKTECRLRDIRDLFLDTGIGTRTYSLIERKMVDSVLSDSTGHRRFMFEEAAGIMKYKVRKRSALNKLAATETDMQRVADIIVEVEKQVRSLKRQLAQARRHRRYTDELRELEIGLGRREFWTWESQREESAARAAELRSTLGKHQGTVQEAERSGLGIRTELRDKEEALSSLELEVKDLESRSRQLADGLLVARERRSAAERRVNDLDKELTDLRADLSLALKRAASLEGEIEQTAGLAQEREDDLSQKDEEAAEIEKKYKRLNDLLAGQKQTRLAGLESSAGLKGELESYRARLDDLMREHVEIENSLAAARHALAEKEGEVLSALEEEKRFMGASHEARTAEHARTTALNDAREARLKARELASRVEGELTAAKHKADLLSEIRDSYGGFQDGVRSLLADRSHSIDGLLGTVADLLDVDPKMAGAVEAALAGTAQYVVTRDLSTARSAMHFLASRSLGRATFLPMSELRRIEVSRVPDHVVNGDGVIGRASDFVSSEGSFSALVGFLLEGIVIVRDLGVALSLAERPEGRDLAFVTPDGEMATSEGVISGGRQGSNEAGLLRRAERVEAAKREIASLSAHLAEARRAEAGAEKQLTEASGAAQAAEGRAETADAELWEVKRRLTEHELAKTNLSERIAELAAQRDVLAARMDTTRGSIESLAERLSLLSKGEDELGEKLDELEREFRRVEHARTRAIEEEKQSGIEAASAQSRLTQLKTEHAQLTETARNAKSADERKTIERTEHLRTVAELDERIAADARALDELNEQKRALETDRDAMREAAGGLKAQLEKLDDDTRSSREVKDRVQTELHELEIRDTERRGRAEAMRDRLREEYSIDIREMGSLEDDSEAEPFDIAKVREEVERLRARLRSMGPVNLLALEEYDEESKRLEFLQGQFEDLQKSKASLLEAIERINSTATQMFVETFKLVRENFIATFQRLFEGGEADLRFLEPEDPLESAIEIVASPRGKRLGRLSLLSGGERALTAIALLFAIYLVKPSPFCILDEVDAPLDDANVERFVKMLKEFSERTQFVIITHNKATMRAGGRLYGITMEESGVSKVVSVRLDTADEEVQREEAVLEAR
jgi:chromosome segregation protein